MTEDLINRRVVLAARPKGVPGPEHFRVEEVPLPDVPDGSVLIRNLFWSVDPAMRGWVNDVPNYLPPVEIGAPMRSFAVGEVVVSNHPGYVNGTMVTGMFGWNRHYISDGTDIERTVDDGLPPSASLGVLGLNGVTAYFGLLDTLAPQPGETVVVSTAAGAVGSVVGQIAKLKGCRTVGITSSDQKAALCTAEYGYDAVINYRTEDVAARLTEFCPDGVDCYFDNTCGPISDAVMTRLAQGARITICGTAAITDWDPLPVGPRVHRQLLVARARMQGFLIFDYANRHGEAVEQLAQWVRGGQITYREHILQGATAAPDAIGMLYRGENTGKLLVAVD